MKTVLSSLAALALAVSFGIEDAHAQPRFDEGGSKFCSVVVPGDWRDTINVPQAWTVEDCDEFRVAMGARSLQIGCIFGRGRSAFSVAEAGYLPRPNCGWEAPRRRERITREPRGSVTDWEIIIERSRRR
jgi:hypothetical protein